MCFVLMGKGGRSVSSDSPLNKGPLTYAEVILLEQDRAGYPCASSRYSALTI